MPEEDPLLSVNERFDELKQKYERLKESHRKLVNVNQNLEDKLLKNINHFEDEKYSLIHTIQSLNFQLEEVQRSNQQLNTENERFKLDISVAVQLLHCKPSSFSSCKLENLPTDFKSKAKCHLQKEQTKPRSERKGKVICVPNSAFPSTTVIYSITPADDDSGSRVNPEVSASTMAKILEERQIDHQKQSAASGRRLTNVGPKRVDHGTQTYPIFIGDRDKTRNTCIFCQGSSPSRPLLTVTPSTKYSTKPSQSDDKKTDTDGSSHKADGCHTHRRRNRQSCNVVNNVGTITRSQTFRETEI